MLKALCLAVPLGILSPGQLHKRVARLPVRSAAPGRRWLTTRQEGLKLHVGAAAGVTEQDVKASAPGWRKLMAQESFSDLRGSVKGPLGAIGRQVHVPHLGEEAHDERPRAHP